MKEPLDLVLVDKRLVESRTKAQWLIRNGHVLVNGKKVLEPGTRINNTSDIELLKKYPYVGKGGLKLEAALKQFKITVENKACVDIGCSIGGFTDCLLKHGARKVYSIDTATELLHPSLRCKENEEKVVPMLGRDAREVVDLREKVDVCTIDITFTSLRDILPNVKNFLKPDGDIIALVKPLFEISEEDKNNFRIVKESGDLFHILHDLKEWGEENGFYAHGLIKSPLKGKGGSIEFFYHFRVDKRTSKFDFRRVFLDISQENKNH